MLAMISEVGELLDVMKWNGDEAVSLPETKSRFYQPRNWRHCDYLAPHGGLVRT
jgi:hypothetical protein